MEERRIGVEEEEERPRSRPFLALLGVEGLEAFRFPGRAEGDAEWGAGGGRERDGKSSWEVREGMVVFGKMGGEVSSMAEVGGRVGGPGGLEGWGGSLSKGARGGLGVRMGVRGAGRRGVLGASWGVRGGEGSGSVGERRLGFWGLC